MEEGYRLLYAQEGTVIEQLYKVIHEKGIYIQGLSIGDRSSYKTGFRGLHCSYCLTYGAERSQLTGGLGKSVDSRAVEYTVNVELSIKVRWS